MTSRLFVSTALLLVVGAGLLDATNQPATPQLVETASQAAVPFRVGERLEFEVGYGVFGGAGTGSMEVVKIDTVRGRPAYHIRYAVKGGIPLYRVNDLHESWIDTHSLSSLTFKQDIDEGSYEKKRHYEMFHDRSAYRDFTEGANPNVDIPSVPNPLDDGAFFYFIRTVPLNVGDTLTFNRYFKPDRNPVTIIVLAKDPAFRTPAGIFSAIVIKPIIKTPEGQKGMFNQDGDARIWLSDDPSRLPLRIQSKVGPGNLHLSLKSVTHRPAAPAR